MRTQPCTTPAGVPAPARWLGALSFALALSACDGEAPTTPPPMTTPTRCGTAGVKSGSACGGLADCGRGQPNQVNVDFCDHCFDRADSHVCESGVCRDALNAPAGSLTVAFAVPDEARGALSFTQAVLLPVGADGAKLTCAALMSTCSWKGNGALNAKISHFQPFRNPSGAADPAYVTKVPRAMDAGTGILVVIRVTSGMQGTGTVVATGCVEGIEVRVNENTDVEVVIEPV